MSYTLRAHTHTRARTHLGNQCGLQLFDVEVVEIKGFCEETAEVCDSGNFPPSLQFLQTHIHGSVDVPLNPDLDTLLNPDFRRSL